jgi:hypothetical protein
MFRFGGAALAAKSGWRVHRSPESRRDEAGAGPNPFQLGAGARRHAIEWVDAILGKARFGRGRWQQFL